MDTDLEQLARELYRAKQSCHNWQMYPWEKVRGQVRDSWIEVAKRAVELLSKEVSK